MLSEARRFCAEMAQGMRPRWLSLLGQPGTGKTHLAKRIYAFFEAQVEGTLVPGQDLSHTRRTMHGRYASWRKVAKALKSRNFGAASDLEHPQFVVLDDIGAEHGSDFVASELDNIIDARLGKWTVITSNFSLDQLAAKDVRVASRLLRGGSVVVHVKRAEDYGVRQLSANIPDTLSLTTQQQ